MLERTLILPDVHITDSGVSKPYKLTKKLIKEMKPAEVIILGDFMDCSSLSHWIEDKKRLLENKRYLAECGIANSELDFIQKYSNRQVYLEGNHEYWIKDYLDHEPQLEGMLEIQIRLELDERDISWYNINELYKKEKCHFTHGVYINKYHSYKHLITYGCSLIYGHTHNAQSAMMNMKMQDPIMSWGLGCLCDHAPHYLKNKPANWINQLGVFESNTKTGHFNFYPVNITDNQFIWGGKQYG